jgi:hypothetical protein
LQSQLGFPLQLEQTSRLTGSTREPKIRLAANRALWFGSNVASDPAQLQIINYTYVTADIPNTATTFTAVQLVPGQDKFSFNAWILDDLSQVVMGLEYACRILICPSVTLVCSEDSSLLAPAYISIDRASGLVRAADISLMCPVDGGSVRVQISLASMSSILTWFDVKCVPCRAGHARTLTADGRAWWCNRCSSKQYVIDPNNPIFRCEVCHLK